MQELSMEVVFKVTRLKRVVSVRKRSGKIVFKNTRRAKRFTACDVSYSFKPWKYFRVTGLLETRIT